MSESWQHNGGEENVLHWAVGKVAAITIVGAMVAGLVVSVGEQSLTSSPTQERSSPAVKTPAATADRMTDGYRTVVLRADDNGHFWTRGTINGADVDFVVDTGATSVAIDRETAARAGVRPAATDFTVRAQTANGIAAAAPVTFRRLRIGALELSNVQAHVLDGSMHGIGLLGMSFLQRLEGYEVRRDRLYLRW
jgi:aspartyl protease family protein